MAVVVSQEQLHPYSGGAPIPARCSFSKSRREDGAALSVASPSLSRFYRMKNVLSSRIFGPFSWKARKTGTSNNYVAFGDSFSRLQTLATHMTSLYAVPADACLTVLPCALCAMRTAHIALRISHCAFAQRSWASEDIAYDP